MAFLDEHRTDLGLEERDPFGVVGRARGCDQRCQEGERASHDAGAC